MQKYASELVHARTTQRRTHDTAPKLRGCCRLVLVGDSGAGKTSLLWRYCGQGETDGLPELRRTFGPWREGRDIKGFVDLDLSWDVAGGSLHDLDGFANQCRGTAAHNRDAEALLLCFSLADPNALTRDEHPTHAPAGERPDGLRGWADKLRARCPAVPIILVGLQTDRRLPDFTEEAGRIAATELGALFYVECSSLLARGGVAEAVERSVGATFEYWEERDRADKARRKKCIVM